MNVSAEIEQFVRNLYDQKCTIIQSIKAVHLRFGLSLHDSKILVSSQPCWSLVVNANRPLHDELEELSRNQDSYDSESGTKS